MVTTAPMSYSDLNLSDPDEIMKVTNNGRATVEWMGTRRQYVIAPKATTMIPFHVVVKYLGDPRSDYKKTETFKTPNGEMGVIPERNGELRRLSVNYGLYQGAIKNLPKVAPKVTVLTLNDIELQFPIYNPKNPTYKYDTLDNRNIDVRTELERLQSQIAALEGRQEALSNSVVDPDSGEAPEDGPPGV
jgi:hypothetical protein